MMSPISSTGKMVGFGMTLLVSLGLLFGRVSFVHSFLLAQQYVRSLLLCCHVGDVFIFAV